MTGLKISNMAKAFLYDDANAGNEDEKYTVAFLNRIIAETFNVENSIRAAKGQIVLEGIPYIEGLEKDIPYDEQMLRTAFVYALAAHYWQEELDSYQAATCQAMYERAVSDLKRAVWVSL